MQKFFSSQNDLALGFHHDGDKEPKGRELVSLMADPLFVNAAKHDFHLKQNSPALRLGFKPFDYSRAGVYGTAAWLGEAERVINPPEMIPPHHWNSSPLSASIPA